MKKVKKVVLLLIMFTLLFSVSAEAKTYKKKWDAYKGETWTIKYKGLVNKKAKWSTSNPQIATVSKTGKVSVKNTGKVTLTAKYKKNTYKFYITATIERKVNLSLGKVNGVNVKIISMTPDWIKIKYTNKTKKPKTMTELYIKLDKKVYYIENILTTVIASKSSRTIVLRRGVDFEGKLKMNAKRFELGWW